MDQSKSSHTGPGPAAGDLWKKVLDEVQSDAAARRVKAAARVAGSGQRAGIELDLLKRILAAIETKTGPSVAEVVAQVRAELAALPRPVDVTPQLKAILDAVRSQPAVDGDAIVRQVVDAVSAHRPAEAVEALRRELPEQIGQALAALPKPVDVGPQLAAILTALQAKPAIDPDAMVARITEAIEQTHPAQKLRLELLEELSNAFEAMPRPVDVGPQIEAVLAAVKGAPRIDSDALAKQVAAAVTAAAAAGQELQAQRVAEEVRAAVKEQLPGSAASAADGAKLDEILAAVNAQRDAAGSAGDAGRDDVLLKVLETVQKPQPTYHERFDELLDRITGLTSPAAATMAPSAEALGAAADAAADRVLAEIRSGFAALPKPVDVAPQLAAILAAVGAQPAVDVDASVRRAVAETLQPAAQEALAPLREGVAAISASNQQLAELMTQRLDALTADRGAAEALVKVQELLAQPRSADDAALKRILELVEKPAHGEIESALKAQGDLLRDIAARLAAAPSAPAAGNNGHAAGENGDAIAGQFRQDIDAAAQTMRDEIAKLREAVREDVASQTAGLREDLLTQSIEVIDQVRAQSPASIVEMLGQLQGQLQSLPSPRDLLDQVRGEIDGKIKAIHDEVARLRDTLKQDLTAQSNQVIDQVRAQSQTLREDVTATASRLRAEIQRAAPAGAAGPGGAGGTGGAALVKDEAVEAVVARLRNNPVLARQEQLLERLVKASGTSGSPIREQARQMLGQLPRLAEWDAKTTKSVERLLESAPAGMGPDLDPFLAGNPPADAEAEAAPGQVAGDYSYSWKSQLPPRKRSTVIAVAVAGVAAVVVILVLLINALAGDDNPASGDDPVARGGPGAASAKDAAAAPLTPSDPRSSTGNGAGNDSGDKAVAGNPGAKSANAGDANKPPVDPGSFELLPNRSAAAPDKPVVPAKLVSALHDITVGGEKPDGAQLLAQARRVVFLVHASGDSPATLSTMIAELKKYMAQLKPTQMFTIVFSDGKRFLEPTPQGLRTGSADDRASVETWIDLNIRASSLRPGNNPLAALDAALLSYPADLLWIISDGIAGSGDGQLTSKELLERVATLNPKGETRIAATQIGAADSDGTLKALAKEYGGGYFVPGEDGSAPR